MEVFTIDEDKCRACTICATECPMRIIRAKPGKFPRILKGMGGLCIGCGHCEAICPHKALHLQDGLPDTRGAATDFIPLPKSERVDFATAARLLKSRRSIRAFRDTPVEPGVVSEVLDVAQYAPSGHNVQPTRWLCVQDRAGVEAVCRHVVDWMEHTLTTLPEEAGALNLSSMVRAWNKGRDIITHDAPALLAAAAPKAGVTPGEDAVICLTHAELAAHARGLGACWGGFVVFAAKHHQPLRDHLGIADTEEVYGALMVGWPRFSFRSIPPRPAASITWL